MNPCGGLIRVRYRHKLNNGKRQSRLGSPVVHLDGNWVRIRWDKVDGETPPTSHGRLGGKAAGASVSYSTGSIVVYPFPMEDP